MTFASFSTVIAVFENLISCCIDNFGWSRKKAVTINLLFMLAASMPCVLGFNVWSSWHPIGTMDVLGSEDFIVSNILLPAGALIYLLFCTTKWGWGFDNYIAEANTGSGMKMPVWLKGYFQWILPLLIVGIFVTGLL
jgi:NSS family neurotransmitter:Na+ symporter